MSSIGLVGDGVSEGFVQNSQGVAVTINGRVIAVRGDRVTPHPPCPRVQSHCAATMLASAGVTINGLSVVVSGDVATCGHAIAASARSFIQ